MALGDRVGLGSGRTQATAENFKIEGKPQTPFSSSWMVFPSHGFAFFTLSPLEQ